MSCLTNLLGFYGRVSNISEKRDEYIDWLFLDYKNAFDAVIHVLLKMLEFRIFGNWDER